MFSKLLTQWIRIDTPKEFQKNIRKLEKVSSQHSLPNL